MERVGVEPNVVITSILLNALCENGKLVEACRLTQVMSEIGLKPGFVNMLLKGTCEMGKAQMALQLLGEVSHLGGICKPNDVTFNTVIDGLCKEGSVDCALLRFSEMSNQSIMPGGSTYNAVIHGLSSVFRWEEAMLLLNQMKEKGFP